MQNRCDVFLTHTVVHQLNKVDKHQRKSTRLIIIVISVSDFIKPLAELNKEWGDLTMRIGMKAMQNPDEVGAAAVDYMYYSGYVTLAYLWARMVKVSQEALAGETTEQDFYNAKVKTAQFYFKKLLPRTKSHVARIDTGVESLMALDAEHFAF